MSNYPDGWSSRDECASGICGGCENCGPLFTPDEDALYEAWRDEQIATGMLDTDGYLTVLEF